MVGCDTAIAAYLAAKAGADRGARAQVGARTPLHEWQRAYHIFLRELSSLVATACLLACVSNARLSDGTFYYYFICAAAAAFIIRTPLIKFAPPERNNTQWSGGSPHENYVRRFSSPNASA